MIWRLVKPAWWCESCQQWWPGAWVIGLPVEPTAADVDAAKPYTERSCAECGSALIPRGRPLPANDGHEP